MSWRERIAQAITGIKAYHSSPHDFDRFDLSKIGTGEGAQVYGHGLYFAENPAVSGQGGQYWNQFQYRFPPAEVDAAGTLKEAGFDRARAIEIARKERDDHLKFVADQDALDKAGHNPMDQWQQRDYERSKIRAQQYQQQIDLLQSGNPVGPRTYEVNIKADPAQFLDWDKPIAGQSAGIRELASEIPRPLGGDWNPTGEYLHSALVDYMRRGGGMTKFGAREAAASDLRSVGVPGIRYLDQGSRLPTASTQWAAQYPSRAEALAAAEQQLNSVYADPTMTGADRMKWQQLLSPLKTPESSNYVVFDPSTVDILKKYGVVGAPAGTLGMGALADPAQYPVDQAPP